MNQNRATEQHDGRSGAAGAGNGVRWSWVDLLVVCLVTGTTTGAFAVGFYHLVEYAFERQGGKVMVLLLMFVVMELLVLTISLIRKNRSLGRGSGDTARAENQERAIDSIGIPRFLACELVIIAMAAFIIFAYLRSLGPPALKEYGALIFFVAPFSQVTWDLASAWIERRGQKTV